MCGGGEAFLSLGASTAKSPDTHGAWAKKRFYSHSNLTSMSLCFIVLFLLLTFYVLRQFIPLRLRKVLLNQLYFTYLYGLLQGQVDSMDCIVVVI